MNLRKKFKLALISAGVIATIATSSYFAWSKFISSGSLAGFNAQQKQELQIQEQEIKDKKKLLKIKKAGMELANKAAESLESAQGYYSEGKIEKCLGELINARGYLEELKKLEKPNKARLENINYLEGQLLNLTELLRQELLARKNALNP